MDQKPSEPDNVPADALKPSNTEPIQCDSPAVSVSEQPSSGLEKPFNSRPEKKASHRMSRQSVQTQMSAPVHSPHSNPDNNYYRQHGCRVSRRVSVLEDSPKSYCRESFLSPTSRGRRFLDKVRTRLQFPAISLERKLSVLSNRELLVAESRRDYEPRKY